MTDAEARVKELEKENDHLLRRLLELNSQPKEDRISATIDRLMDLVDSCIVATLEDGKVLCSLKGTDTEMAVMARGLVEAAKEAEGGHEREMPNNPSG